MSVHSSLLLHLLLFDVSAVQLGRNHKYCTFSSATFTKEIRAHLTDNLKRVWFSFLEFSTYLLNVCGFHHSPSAVFGKFREVIICMNSNAWVSM